MRIEPRGRHLVIEEWVREINGRKYKFRVTYWLPTPEAIFSVWRRDDKFGWTEVHAWRVKADGSLEGTYR